MNGRLDRVRALISAILVNFCTPSATRARELVCLQTVDEALEQEKEEVSPGSNTFERKKNNSETSFIHGSGNAYVLKTGAFCNSSGSGDSQRLWRTPVKAVSRTTSETINLPRLSVIDPQCDAHTLTKSIGKQRTTG